MDILEMEEKCTIGDLTASECHKTSFIKNKGTQNISNLSEEEINLIKLRTGKENNSGTICFHHTYYFLNKFNFFQKKCCDPYKKHRKPITKTLREVTVQQSKSLILKGLKIKPGEKICSFCRKILFKNQNTDSSSGSEENDDYPDMQKEVAVSSLNLSLTEVGCSPIKLHALNEYSKPNYAKAKIEKVQENVKKKIELILDVEVPESKTNLEKTVEEKAADMDKLINNIKDDLHLKTNKKLIQLLTIPASLNWSRQKIKDTFQVSDYCVRQAQKIFKEKGLLAEPDSKRGKTLKAEVVELVKQYYQSNEHSRVLPGMKDVVSIGKKQHERKRLVLGNLHEIYSNFKKDHPEIKVGFSKFCSLRPKWCVLAGASGTHSVCVCTIHQNVILLIQAAHLDQSYKELTKMLVCENPSRECMLRHCNLCPGKENFISFLRTKFEDYDEDDAIEFNQWISTDRTQMITQTAKIEDYIEDLSTKLDKLIPHSFIAKSQSKYFKTLKESSDGNTAVVSMDFSENYSFTIQDEAQGYHWTSDSCTVHPIIINLTSAASERLVLSLCIISDDMKHDVSMVHKIQGIVTTFLKENYSHITHVHYFSDGCAGQYKNKFNFFNLCMHEKDFKLKAQWSFFATSHGKTECDGIGGTVKRLARKESLQRPLGNQIITPIDMFNFCKSKITNVRFYFISKDDMHNVRQELENRFADLQTLPGTRSFHNFRTIDCSGNLEARRISSDEEPTLSHNVSSKLTSFVTEMNITLSCYVACIYDDRWYFGIITEVNKEEGDVTVQFLHPAGPSRSFQWPKREDICPIPTPHILAIVDPPDTATGRSYRFPEECMRSIQEKFSRVKNQN